MDKGEFVTIGYIVEPGLNGSWAVFRGGTRYHANEQGWHMRSEMINFSNSTDLLSWLDSEHTTADKRQPARSAE